MGRSPTTEVGPLVRPSVTSNLDCNVRVIQSNNSVTVACMNDLDAEPAVPDDAPVLSSPVPRARR